jgi:methyltransferase (TIGR00027 family)
MPFINENKEEFEMEIIALLVFIIVQIVFIPLAIIGVIIITIKQILVSKKLGVSSTAISVIGNRWLMDVFGLRKDTASAKLYLVLPNGSVFGLWLLFFPSYLRYKISGKNKGYASFEEEGMEGIGKLAITRTIYFDKLISKSIDKVEQFVVMGAGYDTRCYGDLKRNNLKFFELDQSKTQKLKVECLKEAEIDTSHVTFIEVDFSSENWYEKLEDAGYDSSKKSIFLWEGVTPYLSEIDARKTLKEIKAHAALGSILLADLYAKRLFAALKGVKATNEGFDFGLDFSASANNENVLKAFLESESLNLGDFHLMGYKTKKGAFGVVAEIIV